MRPSSTLRRAGILLPRLESGDAVGHDAIMMQRTLREAGFDAQLFAPNGERKLSFRDPGRLHRFLESPEDLLIYHYCIGWDQALALLSDIGCIKYIKYHSITPPKYYAPYNKMIASVCALGLEMLPNFIRLAGVQWLADSAANRDELARYGLPGGRCRVLPPFHRIEELLSLSPDLDRLAQWRSRMTEAPLYVMVGRLAPNKGHIHLLRALKTLRRFAQPRARLLLPGHFDPAIAGYYRELNEFIEEHKLHDAVLWPGKLSAAGLKSAYLAATAFVTFSEHEGFCVPVVEAQALAVPVLASPSGALPETLGDGAVFCPPDEDYQAAALLDEFAMNDELRWQLIERGKTRYQDNFHPAQLQRQFLESIGLNESARGIDR